MQGGGNKPCRFGDDCRKLQSGTCTFYHPPNQGGQQQGGRGGFGGQQQGGFQGGSRQPNFPQQQGNFGQQGQGGFNPNWGSGGFGGGRGGPREGGNGGQGQNQGESGYKGKGGNDPFFSLCRNYHFAQQCQYGENCKKKHYFIMNDEHAIRRFNFMRNIPNALQSKLSKFRSGGKDYFVLRNGNMINFFDFNFQTKALSDVFTWNLPELPNGLKYNYYDHHGDYIYFSFPNPQTMLEDMSLFHIPTQKIIHVSNSHSGRLTGMVHFNDNVLLTTSMAGELKVWLRDGQTFVQQPEYTEKLRLNFNPQNLKLQLLFLDVSQVNGTKIIAAGTNDGRLLFFIGNDLAFQQVVFKGDAYSKVFGVKYANRPGNPPVPCAIVLLWNTQQTLTSLLQVNLTNFEQALLTQNQGQDNRTNICFFELVDQMLMVGTMGGDLSIYRFPDTTERIGAIMHQNPVTDIVYCEEELKNTGTKVKYMLVLERKTDKKEGSLGFYILK